ncbi:MAG: hypothetical protein K6F77_05640, partial [Lachnospiraceae bacterium]|nr:hypothetical protein [Lachnospiraceae bacterium]
DPKEKFYYKISFNKKNNKIKLDSWQKYISTANNKLKIIGSSGWISLKELREEGFYFDMVTKVKTKKGYTKWVIYSGVEYLRPKFKDIINYFESDHYYLEDVRKKWIADKHTCCRFSFESLVGIEVYLMDDCNVSFKKLLV